MLFITYMSSKFQIHESGGRDSICNILALRFFICSSSVLGKSRKALSGMMVIILSATKPSSLLTMMAG